MIRRRLENTALFVMTCVALAACGESGSGDYCDNHFDFHAGHRDAVAELSIELDEAGVLNGRLQLPNSALDDMTPSDIEVVFANAENTFAVQSDIPCDVYLERVYSNNYGLEAHYTASCGTNNKIGKIDVALFDHVSGLEEIVTSVTTPATAKRFGISRQCDAPIFRLD